MPILVLPVAVGGSLWSIVLTTSELAQCDMMLPTGYHHSISPIPQLKNSCQWGALLCLLLPKKGTYPRSEKRHMLKLKLHIVQQLQLQHMPFLTSGISSFFGQ